MFSYYIHLLFIVSLAILAGNMRPYRKIFLLYIFITSLFFIGLRLEIGGDWGAYLGYYNLFSDNIDEILRLRDVGLLFVTDIGYSLINIVSAYLSGGIALVNTISALIFLTGLFYFLQGRPYLSLALVISFQYLGYVVAMGYTRQSIAIGVSLIALKLFENRKFSASVFVSLLAVLFHKTAIFVTLLILITYLFIQKSFKVLFWLFSISTIFFMLFQDQLLVLYHEYIVGDMISYGALYRLSIQAITSLLYIMLFYTKKRYRDLSRIWLIFAYTSIILLVAMPVIGSTTADRLSLYLYPLQIILYPTLLSNFSKSIRSIVYFVLAFMYVGFLTVFLLKGVEREHWIPYKNYVLEVFK